jgi:glycoprotein endo-alpha-1,2-mannosidase
MRWLAEAHVGVITYSWWGQGSYEDNALPLVLDIAHEYGIKVNFHLEPYPGRTAESVKNDIIYIIDTYGDHPAFYRDPEYGNRPFFYVFESSWGDRSLSPWEWATILSPDGSNTIRGTPYDSVVIGQTLLFPLVLLSHFDGLYNYGIVYPCTFLWNLLSVSCWLFGKIFAPSVGPGYIDDRAVPDGAPTIPRKNMFGWLYYEELFNAAIYSCADRITITSFNEWHEGTQIEPAVPKSISGFEYEDYSPEDPMFYLTKTAELVERYEAL